MHKIRDITQSALERAEASAKLVERLEEETKKLELVPPPTASIGGRSEIQVARKEAKLDQQVLPSASAFEKGRTKGKEKGKDKTKDKGKGKSKEGDPKKQVA